MEEHVCKKFTRKARRMDDFFGSAIFRIEKIDGRWVAHNDEYASYINFCPFCGEKLD